MKKAQAINNAVEEKLGIVFVSYQISELLWLQAQLTKFLDLDIDTDDLVDSEDSEEFDEEDDLDLDEPHDE